LTVPTTLTTRETAGTGATVKDAPLTNAEVDNNFISISDNKLEAGNNLSDLLNAATARDNLGTLTAADNLSDLPNVATARDNLGTLTAADNLSDLPNASTARQNLGLDFQILDVNGNVLFPSS